MREKFELSLWRDNVSPENKYIKEEKIMILANENLEQFQGKIYNIHLISKIDGSKSVTFEVPQYYQDIYSNTRKPNEYLDFLRMKSKIKLFYKDKWNTFIINTRVEKKSKGYITYSFECTDLTVEELSKNGYSLNLTDSEETIELCGLGNIKELTDRVLANTDWKYDSELTTANLQETIEKQRLNGITGKYENYREPVMIYESHYSPCLKKYVYRTELDYFIDKDNLNKQQKFYNLTTEEKNIHKAGSKSGTYPIYYTTETSVETSGTTDNLIVTNSDFSKKEDWYTEDGYLVNYQYQVDNINKYGLIIKSNQKGYTNNFTKKSLKSIPYIFKITTKDDTNVKCKISLTNGNATIFSATLETNTSYFIYPNKSISTPELIIDPSGTIYIEKIELFELNIRKKSTDEALTPTSDNLNIKTRVAAGNYAKINYKEDSTTNRGFIQKNGEDNGYYIILPNAIVSAKARPLRRYFVEPFDTLEKAQEFKKDYNINELEEDLLLFLDEDKILSRAEVLGLYSSNRNNKITLGNGDDSFTESSITLNAKENFDNNITVEHINSYEDITYYSVKNIKYKDTNYYLWKNSLLKYSDNKRRLVTASKSNRWNIIQDIAEKFEVYPKFTIMHNPVTGEYLYKDGKPIKRVYYVDRYGKVNYSGFKEGINLESTDRKIISDEIVTKMYVNNIESDYNENGLISIQLSDKNPSKENYIYNFTHYLNTGVLSQDFIAELDNHNAALKKINKEYLRETEKLNILLEELSQKKAFLDTTEKELESSKSEIEKIRETLSPVVKYYSCGDTNNYIPYSDLKGGNKSPYKATIDGEIVISEQSLNTFYLTKEGFYIKDTKFDKILEVDTIFDERNKANIDKSSSYEKLIKFGKNKFKKSKNAAKDYILASQTESYYPNSGMPYQEDLTYCTVSNGKYTIKNYNKDNFDKNCYVLYVTSANSQWFAYGKKFVQCLVNSKGERCIKIARNPVFIKANKTGVQEFSVYATSTRKLIEYEITEGLLVENATTIKSKRDAIQSLISGEVGQVSIIKKLHQAKVQYYKALEDVKNKQNIISKLLKDKNTLVSNFENKYIQYIKEGYWGESGYSDNNTYYIDACCASNNSALPKVQYTISVLDLSSIPYYKDYSVNLGDETFITDKDMFGVDSNGVPKRERVIITQLDEQLDKSSNNKITIKNYTSRFEDLFERLSASLTSVESAKETWDRASILNNNGTINSELLTTIYGQNSEWVNSSIGTRNNFVLNENGLTLTSEIEPEHQIRITSMGVFLTQSALSGNNWTTGITAEGINATAIKVGTLDTNKITIQSEVSPAQVWDSLGISCYSSVGITDGNMITDPTTFVRLDQFGLYMVDNNESFNYQTDGKPWWYGETFDNTVNEIINKSTVSITKKGFSYNSNTGTGARIRIGSLPNEKDNDKNIIMESGDGIRLIDSNNYPVLEAVTKKNGDYYARIAGFKFESDKIYYEKAGNSADTLNGAFKTENGFAIVPGKGLAMHNIKLESKNGLATFGNIKLTGGEINGPVYIKKAQMGPFYVQQDENYWLGEYIFARVKGKDSFYNFLKPNKSDSLDIYGPAKRKDKQSYRLGLLTMPNKFYLGEFKLNRSLLSHCGFDKKLINKIGKDDKNGILLSIGDDFWMHSSGYGYIGGNININGTLYADKISANQIEYQGQNIGEYIKTHGPDIVDTVNNALKTRDIKLGPEQLEELSVGVINQKFGEVYYKTSSGNWVLDKTFSNKTYPSFKFINTNAESWLVMRVEHNERGSNFYLDLITRRKLKNGTWGKLKRDNISLIYNGN